MPTWQENVDLQAIEQDRAQLATEERLSGEPGTLLSDLGAKEKAVREILELTKDRPECVGDERRANEKLAKFASERAVLERRINDNQHRIHVFRGRIANIAKGMDQGKLERAGRIRSLFAGLR